MLTLEAHADGSEEALIARVQAGDHKAYRLLIDRYAPLIFQLVRRFSASEPDAEDLAQEVFIKAYRALGRFKQQARFSSWLYAIALNHCRDYARRAQRRYEQHHTAWEEVPGSREPPTRFPDPQPWRRLIGQPACNAPCFSSPTTMPFRFCSTTTTGCRTAPSPVCSAPPKAR